MKIGRTFSGLLLVFAAACIGLALIYLPHLIISTYSKVAMLGSIWGILYLCVVGLGPVSYTHLTLPTTPYV